MASIVEGDWKDYHIKMISSEDFPAVLDHLHRNFYVDEPLNKLIGQGEQKTKDMDKFAVMYMEQGLSFMATHKDSGKVAGVRVTGISNKDEDLSEMANLLESEELKNLFPNILQLLKEGNIYEKLGVDKYGDFLFVSVDREFRGQGLATELYKRAVKLLQSHNVPAAESIFTSPYTQKIARSMGFQELTRRKFSKFVGPNGDYLFPSAPDDDVAIVMGKKIIG